MKCIGYEGVYKMMGYFMIPSPQPSLGERELTGQ